MLRGVTAPFASEWPQSRDYPEPEFNREVLSMYCSRAWPPQPWKHWNQTPELQSTDVSDGSKFGSEEDEDLDGLKLGRCGGVDIPVGQEAFTTVMVRNVPIKYTQAMLLAEWPNNGDYDFLHLPVSNDGDALHRNLSYAFINFTSQEKALAFKEQWQGKRLAHFSSRKPLNISHADIQGRNSNLLQMKKKMGRGSIHMSQPVVFQDGVRISFEEALGKVHHTQGAGTRKGSHKIV